MTIYHVDLNEFPTALHRIVRSWYCWHNVFLRKRGGTPEQNAPEQVDASPRISWGGVRPPRATSDNEFCFIDDYELAYYLVIENSQYYIEKKSRGSRNRYWMFRRFEDAEKYMLFLISQMARPGKYTDSPAFRWYQEGLDPRVTLTKPDPVNYPGRVSLRVEHEPADRGWMGQGDAPAASHVLLLDFEELESVLREGIPPAWFSINIVSEA